MHHSTPPRTVVKLLGIATLALSSGLQSGDAWAQEEAASMPPPADRKVDFAKDIRPIFEQNCYTCHGPKRQKADLRLDEKASILKGGAEGPAVVPGHSAESPMIERVSGVEPDLIMPPRGERLTAEQVGLLRAWIDQGAELPEDYGSSSEQVDHWAFRPPVRPALPSVSDETWVRNPIDRFVLARLDREGIKPSPEADRITLIRRLSLDLIGLPPTIEEVDAFLADQRPDAYERLVERLLASPHYGERWGRYWLDAARYADSDGFEKDKPRYIWFYRDWVINAFNRDLPPGKPSYANACLLARRLVERGVRFVQIFHEAWDHHGGLTQGLKSQCGKTDKASAALVKDLKQRGLLDDTLVIWGGEFGRTPMVQGGNDGRDHHPNAFTMWLAGGGIKPGITLGRSDDLGFNVVEDRVHVHDLQATILHLLGFDHTRLTYRFQGRDFRLTDVAGEVVHKLLA